MYENRPKNEETAGQKEPSTIRKFVNLDIIKKE